MNSEIALIAISSLFKKPSQSKYSGVKLLVHNIFLGFLGVLNNSISFSWITVLCLSGQETLMMPWLMLTSWGFRSGGTLLNINLFSWVSFILHSLQGQLSLTHKYGRLYSIFSLLKIFIDLSLNVNLMINSPSYQIYF